ncbi:MAG: hypothetical protein ABSB40_09315 [Nitrososphaeria archaeon]|jgi:hypothetical protein
MSEYKKQIAAGALTAVVIALILAGGASYLFPLQPTQTTSTIINHSSAAAATASTTKATSAAITSIPQTTSSGTTFTTSTTYLGTTTTIYLPPTMTLPTNNGTTIITNGTMTYTITPPITTVTTTIGPIVTVTVTQNLIKDIEITYVNFNASIPTHVFVGVKNAGTTDQTVTEVLVNGIPLSSVNGGTSNPSLPITIAAGRSQEITLTFSSPLPSGTYFITILPGD